MKIHDHNDRLQYGYQILPSEHFLTDPCKDVKCNITGERCADGKCTCNATTSCVGDEKVNFCDFAKGECKCAENVPACVEGQKCVDGECKGISN